MTTSEAIDFLKWPEIKALIGDGGMPINKLERNESKAIYVFAESKGDK